MQLGHPVSGGNINKGIWSSRLEAGRRVVDTATRKKVTVSEFNLAG
jgi:hypothetical protein